MKTHPNRKSDIWAVKRWRIMNIKANGYYLHVRNSTAWICRIIYFR